ncbi:unnamed protein product [Peronospora belbahrii]|uniref:Methyltransferase small domain-containing protein n=1 Tax=Peronospora belbahrii TaxID=622444 RepID=A0AAU9L1X1_9STRA|nr:unnamed protein product [Peronospora belbahrii]CAH0514911.1 unnamed protein product [Peronospora belbahrii]
MNRQEHEASFCLHRPRINSLQDPRNDVCVRVVQNTTLVDGLGGEVWAGAIVLCEFLEAHDQDVVLGRDVIELGAGCGLCGLVAASLGAKTAFLTDEYPDLLARNIARNRHLWEEMENGSVSIIAFSGALEWGVAESISPYANKFDTVIGSEITQVGRDLHVPLLETILCVLRPKAMSLALLSMDLCRAGCKGKCNVNKCTASHFVAEARKKGFTVRKHSSVRLASRKTVTSLVGAQGRPLHVDDDDWSVVFELRLECSNK